MALPQYHEILADPEFSNAPVERQQEINNKYWDLYQKENPDDGWGKQQAENSRKALDAKTRLADASPIQQRGLQYIRDVANTKIGVLNASRTGEFKTQEELDTFIGTENARLKDEEKKIKKINSLFTPEVDQEMQPAWDALTTSARNAGVFGTTGLTSKVFGDVEGSRANYERYRDTMAKDFGLETTEVDDLVKHRMGLQQDDVSRDAAGILHIKDNVLNDGVGAVTDAIEKSNLPSRVKSQYVAEAPERVGRYKEGVVELVKKQHPELASDITFTGDVQKDYKTITDELNTGRWGQLVGGVTEYAAGRGKLLGNEYGLSDLIGSKAPGSDVSVVRDEAGNVTLRKDPTLEERAATNESRISSINQLSHQINQKKVEFLGTDTATIGQGLASAAESVAIGAFTGGAGTALISADRIAKAGKFGKAALLFARGSMNTAPIAGIYGVDQGLNTYQQAIDAGKDPEEAARLAALSGSIEFSVTTFFGGIGLGGTESLGQRIASPAARRAIAKEVADGFGKFGLGVGKDLVGENLEENTIAALDTLFVQTKLNPNMTVDDFKKALYDTTIATTIAIGPLSGITGAVENLHAKSTTELHDTADRLYTEVATQENVPPTQNEGGDVTAPSPARVAPTVQMTREELQSAVAERKQELIDIPDKSSEQQAELDLLSESLETVAKERNVEILTEQSETPTTSLPEGNVPAAGISGDITLTEQDNEQDTTNTGGEQDQTSSLQLPEVPTVTETSVSAVETGGPAEATGAAEAEVQGEVVEPVPADSPKAIEPVRKALSEISAPEELITALAEAMGIAPETVEVQRGNLTQGELELQQSTKGQVSFRDMSKALITLFDSADASTAVHEMSHVARNFLFNRDIPQENRLGISDTDITAAEKWAGAKNGVWDRASEEKFARGFEKYVRDGKFPENSKLEGLFKKLSDWLKTIYKAVEGSSIDIPITPEIRQIFDKLITRGEVLKNPAKKKLPPRPSTNTTSITRAATDEELKKFGLSTVYEHAKKALPDTLNESIKITEEDPNRGEEDSVAKVLIADIMKSPRATTDVENGVLLLELQRAKAEYARAAVKLDSAKTEAATKKASDAVESALRDIEDVITASRLSGSEWGRAGRFKQIRINDDYSIAAMTVRLRMDGNGNAALSDAQKKAVAEFSAKIEAAEKKAAVAEAALAGERKKREDAEVRVKRAKSPALRRSRTTILDRAESARKKLSQLGFSKPLLQIAEDVLFQSRELTEEEIRLFAEVGSAYILSGKEDFDSFKNALVSEFGEDLAQHAEMIHGAAQALVVDEEIKAEDKKDAQLIKASESRKAKIEAKIAAKDFAKAKRAERQRSKELDQALYDEKLVKMKWRREVEKAEMARRHLVRKVWDRVVSGPVSFARTVITSFDLPPIFRQGSFVSFSHPTIAVKAAGRGIKAGVLKREAVASLRRIDQLPFTAIGVANGLSLTESGGDIDHREEAFRGELARRIPGIGFSERNYVTSLNEMRALLFNQLAAGLSRKGTITAAEAKVLANHVNNATGRGSLAGFESSAKILSDIFFSPKYFASRLRLILGAPITVAKAIGGPAEVRRAHRAIAFEYARFVGGVSALYTLYALAKAGFGDDDDEDKIQMDPTKYDFGALKIGGKLRDPFGGLLQTTVLFARLGKAAYDSATNAPVEYSPYAPTATEVGKRLVIGKLAPVWSHLAQGLDRKTFNYRKTSLKLEAFKLATPIPLPILDIMEVSKREGQTLPKLTDIFFVLLGSKYADYDDNLTPHEKLALKVKLVEASELGTTFGGKGKKRKAVIIRP